MSWIRSVVAIALGVAAVVVFFVTVGQSAMEAAYRAFGPPEVDGLVRPDPTNPVLFSGIVLGSAALLTAVGGVVAGLLAPTRPLLHAAIVGLISGMIGVILAFSPPGSPGRGDELVWAAGVILPAIVSTLVGGYIGAALRHRTRAAAP